MALHDELADLRAQVGPQVFDDPVAFRAAFDDFVSEGAASTGEVSLLVGAIATGALQRLKDQLALGADPATSIAVQGDLLARDRGTSETDGSRWALSVLAHAAGFVPVDLVLTRPSVPDSLGAPDRPASTDPGLVDPGPTHGITVERGAAPTPPGPSPAIADPGQVRGRRTSPLLIGTVAVLAVVAVTAIVLLFLRDGDPADDAADDSSSTAGDGSGSDSEEDVLDRIELTAAGKTVRVELRRADTDVSVVLLAEHDGDYAEVDRVPGGCPWTGNAYEPAIQSQGDNQIYWGWLTTDGPGFGTYGEVLVADEKLVSFRDPGEDDDCPTS